MKQGKRLTDAEVANIKRMLEAGQSVSGIARTYGCHEGTVGKIKQAIAKAATAREISNVQTV